MIGSEPVAGAAPAAEPSPTIAEAPQSSTEPTGGAAPSTPVEPPRLTPYQRRKQIEADRKKKADQARERRAAKKGGGKAAAAAAQTAEPSPATDDDRDDAQRARETGGAWRLTLRIVGLLLYPFGWRLEQLTDRECSEDVALLAPLARRHRWLDLLIRYAALPYLLVERVVSKAQRREPPKPKGAS